MGNIDDTLVLASVDRFADQVEELLSGLNGDLTGAVLGEIVARYLLGYPPHQRTELYRGFGALIVRLLRSYETTEKKKLRPN